MMKQSGGVMRSGSRYSIRVSLLVLLIAGLAVAPAWSEEKASAPVQAGAGKTIVEVNGLSLTQGELDQKVNRTIDSLKNQIPADQLEEFKKNVQGKIVDDFINRTIITQEMDKQKITIDEGEVQKALDEVAAKVPQGMTLEDMLKQGGVTMTEMKDNIRFSLRANKLFDTQVKTDYVPTAQEISAYYNENKTKYDMPESVHARHILIQVDEKADDKTKAEKKGKIEAARKQLVDGADFAKLAGEVSDCPSKAKGGDLGTFPRGRMVKPFEDAAFSQKVNEIGPVIQTQFGYHIVQVIGHDQAKQKSLEEVKASIEETLQNRKRQESAKNFMDQLKQKAKIVYPGADAAKKQP